jgi:catechol 2,3-dioxygenase-like lactoylglutathione lyase family enzyme
MNLEFLATVAVIAPDPPASRKLYVETLGLPLESQGGDYHHSGLPPVSWRGLRLRGLPSRCCLCV